MDLDLNHYNPVLSMLKEHYGETYQLQYRNKPSRHDRQKVDNVAVEK
ncbi:uncharacterized protein MP3633_1700 [Marinomonas primoryensis]|uniref:Uncharacterized protein n=1 Tax=Marinomonas primoryensis TaxID=178399 RepID=A0A859D171_9GAMM|nr:uncharacterized protein MP3633_1700 [Marinomonas primoryensis]